MAGMTLKKLEQIAKSLEAVFDGDEEQLAAVEASVAGLRAAIEKGETVSVSDVSDILGEIVITKAIDAEVHPEAQVEEPIDPLAPLMRDLFAKIFDAEGKIQKGMDAPTAQALFQKTYTAMLGELDNAIGAAAEATAIELGQGDQVNFGKHAPGRSLRKPSPGSKPGEDGDAEQDNEDEEQDMEKLLKSLGVAPAIVKKIGALQATVDQLQTERDIALFSKQAEEIGEPASFGAELLRLHTIDPRMAESISKRLQTKNAALRKSAVWGQEIGGEGSAAGSASEKITARANELVEKGTKDAKGQTMTFAKAFTRACEMHPDLYAEYQDERRRAQSPR
jgi:hypothetical protein